MEQSTIRRLALLILFFVVSTSFLGCAQIGRYSLIESPSKRTDSFQNCEVGEVTVGITQDELNPETLIDLRMAIIDAINKKRIYQSVMSEFKEVERAIRIECNIVVFDKGNQFARWFIGWGVGQATLEVSCKFIDKEQGTTFASGGFTGVINGGFFGGTADQKILSKLVANAVAKFLKKGE